MTQPHVFDSQSLPLVEEMYTRFRTDPTSVGAEWKSYFLGWEAAGSVQRPATAGSGELAFLTAWRTRGHLAAATNPLASTPPALPAELKAETYGLDAAQTDHMARIYAGSIGVETAHMREPAEAAFVHDWFESGQASTPVQPEVQRALYTGLVQANALEQFLHKKFVGAKRFSVEGNDGILPLLRELAEWHAAAGGNRMVMGMAHRGRLNVLCNLLHKPFTELFAAFAESLTTTGGATAGDVKYHMGKTYVHHTRGGQNIMLQLLFNPSHLEAVNPSVIGMARGFIDAGESVLPVLIHGDSAVSGQGVVAETNNLMALPPYTVGGTIHFVLNNQVGFTANPADVASGPYCTDTFTALGIPVLHINADDIEACLAGLQFAYSYRTQFGKDVALDLIGYRRWGHNEGDDPTFTQPVLYSHIRNHPVPAEVYKAKLLAAGADATPLALVETTYADELNAAFATAQKGLAITLPVPLPQPEDPTTVAEAGTVARVADAFAKPPKGFELNDKVHKVLEERVAMLRGEKPLNWGAAETAAYGCLLQEGIGVRLTGQDVQRGTFSHRQAVVVNGADATKWNILQSLSKEGVKCDISTSALTENAVLGFEYGYAMARPQGLTLWEGQFGDFANGAQVVIDQFIASAESKWAQYNGIALLLPHGYEGQGPEHSSARLERYLQLCAEGNMTVAMPSTPAQIFHLLRRQAKLGVKRPLVVMTPKSLLRNPHAVSPLSALLNGAWQPVIADGADAKGIKKVVLCSGKIYYDLQARKEAEKRHDVALIRVEQLYPWPEKAITEALKPFKTNTIMWAQEEPRNMGAWSHVREFWNGEWGYLHYVGRPASASPAVGTTARHAAEQKAIVDAVFGDDHKKPKTKTDPRLGEAE